MLNTRISVDPTAARTHIDGSRRAVINAALSIGCLLGIASTARVVADDKPFVPDPGFVSMFDGKTLAGWAAAPNAYAVEDGNLICVAGGKGNLLSEKEYTDFTIKFEFKLTEGANNGLGIRCPKQLEGNLHLDGIELQILDDTAEKYKTLKPYQYHGSIYGIVPAKQGSLKPVGEWNQQQVTVQGRRMIIVLNGTTIVDADLDLATKTGTLDAQPHPGLKRSSGHVGFLGHGDRVDFRRLQISVIAADEAAVPPTWSPTLMMQVKRVGSVQVSPDGNRVTFTVRQAIMEGDLSEYRTHIHLAHTDGSQPRQLTQGEKSCDDPQWSPDGKWIAFVSGRLGKKNLWVINPDGGEAIPLTELKSDVGSFRWSPLGDSLALTAIDPPTEDEERKTREKNDAKVVDENIKLNRLYAVDFNPPSHERPKPRQLTTGRLSIVSEARAGRSGYDWSPDGKTIVVAHATSPRPDDWGSADLSLVDVATGTVRPLVNSNSAETAPLFSPDGKSIAYTASDNPPTWGGNRTVHVIPSTGGTAAKLADTRDGFGRHSELVGWSADGSRLYFTEIQGTSMRALELPIKGTPVEINHCWGGTPSAGMSQGGFSLNSTRTHFGFGWEQLDQPSEAFVIAVGEIDPKRVSTVHADLLMPPLEITEAIVWKSTEEMEIEGLLTYPIDYEQGKRYPLLLIVHGGPMGVFTKTFDGNAGTYPIAAFAAKGYAVLRPNPRGSSGYGKKFRYANYGDWGGGDFRDIMAGVDHVIAQGIADPDRLGVMGWSYGGFMTSWTITQTKRFRAASVGAGVTNLMSFTGTADIPGFLPDYFGGEYWDKLDAYRSHSAMFQVKGVTTPTLIQHGERDERVPLPQGQELYNALKRQGCTTTMVVYPRTPHGIEEPRLMLDCMTRNLEWFDRYVANPKK